MVTKLLNKKCINCTKNCLKCKILYKEMGRDEIGLYNLEQEIHDVHTLR